MPRRVARWLRLVYSLRHALTARSLVLVASISLAFTFFLQLSSDGQTNPETLVQEALQNVAKDARYAEVYRKVDRLPKDLKYILLWTGADLAPLYYLGTGQLQFIKNNCSVVNCYVTDDKNFFNGDLGRFDAIAFNGRSLHEITCAQYDRLQDMRYPHQKYIYFNMESSDNYPVCLTAFDDFFNWTATYRLDSDVPFYYMVVKNKEGEIVGPSRDMVWEERMEEVDEELSRRLRNKSKAAAWFVSHCSSNSRREKYVGQLVKAMEPYGITVDVFGKCGMLDCPRHDHEKCGRKLEKEYFFYLSMENSFAEDYVTEKLLTALQHDVVPVVFGGADYSRFLPPGSYVDARALSPERLAGLLYRLMLSPKLYREFFRWRSHYTYHGAEEENTCALCAALNGAGAARTSSYTNFRAWWNTKRC